MSAASGKIIDGRALAGRIREDSVARLARLRDAGVVVRLDAVIVGEPEAGLLYARSQEKRCRNIGIEYRLHTRPATTSDDELQGFLRKLSDDVEVTGIMLNLPLPGHLDTPAAQYAIDPYKDVEGVNPANIGLMFYGTPIIAPCTALAVMAILRDEGVEVKGCDVVVVGQGDIVGKPIALALMGEEATVRTCNKYTRDLVSHTRDADILIAAAGAAGLIRAEHVKHGATVIDVGINSLPAAKEGETSRVVGDVCFEEVAARAGLLTPVPGGVGLVTVALLTHSAVEAAAKQLETRRIS